MALRAEHKLSERQAYKIVSLRRSVYRYQPRPNQDREVVKLLLELAQGRPEQGFGKLFQGLRRLGHKWNHKRVYRVYCQLKIEQTAQRQEASTDQDAGAVSSESGAE